MRGVLAVVMTIVVGLLFCFPLAALGQPDIAVKAASQALVKEASSPATAADLEKIVLLLQQEHKTPLNPNLVFVFLTILVVMVGAIIIIVLIKFRKLQL